MNDYLRLAVPWILGTLMFGCGEGKDGAPAACEAGAGGMSSDNCDADGDGHERHECGGDDCDDTRADVHPGGDDTCDGDDNDCDGRVDQDEACDCLEAPPDAELPFTERVCLSGGWFSMGMGITDPQAADIAYIAVPEHRVFVSPYYLDAYEVTNRRFIACLDEGACEVHPPRAVPSAVWKRKENSSEDKLDLPYWGAGAADAEAFCAWAGGWLPSEAQWERAAAGLGEASLPEGGPRPFPNGQRPPTCEEAWTGDCTGGEEFPLARRVGLLRPNPEGLYDLAGNVTEWTADLFSMQAYEACPEPCKNPCFGCADKTGGSELLKPDEDPWPWSHVTRGSLIDSLPMTEAVIYHRSQYRDRSSRDGDGAYPDIFNQGFRCAYAAKPLR